jgi:transposase
VSGRVHSWYCRTLADAALGGRPVAIALAVRRFFCAAPGCPRKTFAEQVEGLTARYARKTPLLAGMLGSIAVALAGRAGSRLAAGLGIPASRQALLRLVMAVPDPQAAPLRVLGVDDFAIRRGQHYGTLLIDIESGAPLDTRWSTGCAPKGGACGRSPATWAGACTPSSASTWQELADGRWKGPRPSNPGPFKPYLDQHADGARGSIRRLFGEITALGYAGSYPVVRDYLTRNRPAREPLPPAPPTVRDVTNWLCRRPDTLTEDEKPRLTAILDRCPELQAASDQVRSFAAMITGLTGQDLPQWRAAARDAALPGIASFAKGLEQDLDAVTSGLTTRWNSGPVEGRVNLR